MKEVLGFVLPMFAALCILGHCTGCTPKEQLTVENAAAVAQYDAALVECKKKGKAAHSLDVYDECEASVSKAFCQSSEALRKEWPRCKEVLP